MEFINNKLKHLFFGSIMHESGNYLRFSQREKTMIKWFAKFQSLVVILIIVWILPITATISHLKDYKALKTAVAEQTIEITTIEPTVAAEPEFDLYEVLEVFEAEISAYNSVPEQTDGDPCTGAFGDVCSKDFPIVANNCYLPGTLVDIDGQIYTVYDRMNSRYGCAHFDIFMHNDISAARNYGRQHKTIKILRKHD